MTKLEILAMLTDNKSSIIKDVGELGWQKMMCLAELGVYNDNLSDEERDAYKRNFVCNDKIELTYQNAVAAIKAVRKSYSNYCKVFGIEEPSRTDIVDYDTFKKEHAALISDESDDSYLTINLGRIDNISEDNIAYLMRKICAVLNDYIVDNKIVRKD